MDELKKELEKHFPNDVQVYDVEYVKEHHMNILRVTIFSDTIEIDLNKCVEITKIVNEIIDVVDPIEDEYYLEVSSKGLEEAIKTIEQYKFAVGKTIYVKLYGSIEKKKEFIGILDEFENDKLYMKVLEKGIAKNYEINISDIASARYHVEI